jgi:hypothetical protein
VKTCNAQPTKSSNVTFNASNTLLQLDETMKSASNNPKNQQQQLQHTFQWPSCFCVAQALVLLRLQTSVRLVYAEHLDAALPAAAAAAASIGECIGQLTELSPAATAAAPKTNYHEQKLQQFQQQN